MEKKIFMQGPNYEWYTVPIPEIAIFDSDCKSMSFDDFSEKYKDANIGMQPYDFKLKMEASMAIKETDLKQEEPKDKPLPPAQSDEVAVFNFRFRGAHLQCPTEWIDDTIILYLKMIDMHGWSFYQSMKVDYDFALPKALENLIAYYTLEDPA